MSPQLVSPPRMNIANPPPSCALVADIGGTNARFAVADLATLALSELGQVLCSEHGTLADAACDYLRRLKEPPSCGAIAVAGPVTSDAISSPIRLGPSPSRSGAASLDSMTSSSSTTSKRSLGRSRILGARSCTGSARVSPCRTQPKSCSALAPASASPVSCGRAQSGPRYRAKAGTFRLPLIRSASSSSSSACVVTAITSPPIACSPGLVLPLFIRPLRSLKVGALSRFRQMRC